MQTDKQTSTTTYNRWGGGKPKWAKSRNGKQVEVAPSNIHSPVIYKNKFYPSSLSLCVCVLFFALSLIILLAVIITYPFFRQQQQHQKKKPQNNYELNWNNFLYLYFLSASSSLLIVYPNIVYFVCHHSISCFTLLLRRHQQKFSTTPPFLFNYTHTHAAQWLSVAWCKFWVDRHLHILLILHY